MATLTKGYSFGASELVTNTKLSNLVDLGTVTALVNADVDAAAAIVGSKLNLAAPGIIGGTTPAAITGTAITGTSMVIGGADINETDLEKIDGITNGTAYANKALVLGASKEIATITTLTATSLVGDLTGDVTGDLTGAVAATTITASDKMQFGGVTDWGTGATGILINGDGYDWASQTVAHIDANMNNTASAAAYHALTVGANQTGDNSCFGTWTELYVKNSVDLTGSDNYASVWGQFEAGTGVTLSATGCFTAGVYANVKAGATLVVPSGHSVNGVRAQLEVAAITNNGKSAAFECLKSGGVDWDYGLYIDDATTAIAAVDGAVTMGTATINGGVFSMIQGGVTSDPTFSITQATNDVVLDQTIGKLTISAATDIYLAPAGNDVIIGTSSVAGNLQLHNAGTLTLYEASDDFNVTLACNADEAVATLTGGLDISAVLTCTSPVFTTPNIGTPSGGTLTNCTGLPAAAVLAGTLGTGAYVFDNTITGVTDLTISGTFTDGTASLVGGAITGLTVLTLPSGAGGTTVDAVGEICVDSTSDTLNFNDGTLEAVIQPIISKSLTVEDPTATEDIGMFYVDDAVTIVKVVIAIVGSDTPSVTWDIRHHTDRSNAGNALINSPAASAAGTSALTTGHVITSFDDATIAADSFIWAETDAQSGTVDEANITIFYRQDA